MASSNSHEDLNSTTLNEMEHLSSLETGDVLFFNRHCLGMRSPLGIGLCLLTKTANRFDHVALLVKLKPEDFEKIPKAAELAPYRSPSDTYVVETNVRGVTMYSLEDRLERTSSNEVAFCPLILHGKESEAKREKIIENLVQFTQKPYQTNLLKILPTILGPPDKLDRIEASVKVQQLQHQIEMLMKEVQISSGNPEKAKKYDAVINYYREAQEKLLHTYFPSFVEGGGKTTCVSELDWSLSPFSVDGVNNSEKMVCTELICNLYLKSAITNGYIPASAQRPFDFFDPSRFNFLEPLDHLGNLLPLKVTEAYRQYWTPVPKEARSSGSLDRLQSNDPVRFSNAVLLKPEGHTSFATVEDAFQSPGVSPLWIAQSATAGDLLRLPFRMFCCGALFTTAQFLCAPWTVKWMESQAGSFMVRGGMWSLASVMWARGLACAAIQSVVLSRLLSSLEVRPEEIMISGAPPNPFPGAIVDWRHPFYTMVISVWVSSAVAHLLTTPLFNAGFYRHFVPLRPGPIPRRFFMAGTFPLAILMPFPAFWLTWYETIGSFILPMRSSVWRPREDLLQSQRQDPWHTDALCSAFAATLVLDAVTYPLETWIRRRSLRRVCAPYSRPKCFGMSRLYAGYRYRFLSNVVVTAGTSAVLRGWGLI